MDPEIQKYGAILQDWRLVLSYSILSQLQFPSAVVLCSDSSLEASKGPHLSYVKIDPASNILASLKEASSVLSTLHLSCQQMLT